MYASAYTSAGIGVERGISFWSNVVLQNTFNGGCSWLPHAVGERSL